MSCQSTKSPQVAFLVEPQEFIHCGGKLIADDVCCSLTDVRKRSRSKIH